MRELVKESPTHFVINEKITGYTQHGGKSVYQHNGYGVNNKSILDTVTNPNKVTYDVSRETFKYYGDSSVVSLNHGGSIVTAWPIKPDAYRFK